MERGPAIMKVGPWGSRRGIPKDISEGSIPAHLESITVRHNSTPGGGRIYAFSFVYVDQNSWTPISVGPWGSNTCVGLEEKIDIPMFDHVNHISGTTDSEGVTSLKIVTSKETEYEFGCKLGRTFSVPLNENNGGKVISFFGISGSSSLAALGVYVTGEKEVVKIGAWGHPQGLTKDINLRDGTPRKLVSVTIYSGDRINGFSFVYINQIGMTIKVSTCGSNKGMPNQFKMTQGEVLNCVTGTTDNYGVTSLTFSTNKGRQYGPYGIPGGEYRSFSLPLQEGIGAALAFFGCSTRDYVSAFGTYVGERTG